MADNLNLEEKLKNCLKSHDASSCIPPVCYSNEEILEIEKDVLFKKQWICIGHVSFLKKAGDYEALQKLPKNASPIRLHNRCKLTGRPKGYMRQFGISRVVFREIANKGLIPGVTKASW